ncbi:acyltransferase family protein [soil metagenome]
MNRRAADASGGGVLRIDIQALRGLAVLLVVMQHAEAGFMRAGHLGVDIFFVISGFLITGMIRRGVEEGGFTFREFYFRRAKRLLPAAYATFTATTVAAVFLLDAREWNDYTAQLAGAVTFTANFVLWQQTGYFEGAAALKPLLHVWSLAIEEQYYLLLPAAMVVMPRRWWLSCACMVLAASLLTCVWLWARHPSAAFYLLPTRAWELALGSVAALATLHTGRTRLAAKWLLLPALATLLAVPVLSTGNAVLDMVAVCLATLIVIVAHHAAIESSRVSAVAARFGDASYSLYLAHWPVFAFLNNVRAGDPTLGELSATAQALAVALALLLGFALFAAVERPCRRARLQPSRRLVWSAVGATAVLALVPAVLVAHVPDSAGMTRAEIAHERRDNVGFSDVCEFYREFSPIPECRDTESPVMLVWGDSFAMHLVPGIAATTRRGVLQATKSSCGPLPGMAQLTDDHPRNRAEDCLAFNASVLDYLARTPGIEVVVLSSPFYPYLDSGKRRLLRRHAHDRLAEMDPGEAVALAGMREAIDGIRALGKRVVVVAPPPSTGFDFSHCIERRASSRTLYGRLSNCNMRLVDYQASKAGVLQLLNRIELDSQVGVVSFDELLCDREECATSLGAHAIYRDEGHFSYVGSRVVAERMRLGQLLYSVAR